MAKINCPACDKLMAKKCRACGFELPKPEKKVREKKPPKPTKEKKSETEIVHQYANILIGKSRTRAHTHIEELKSKKTINKELWQDNEFYFSVVFQSKEQKSAFLEFLTNLYKIEVEPKACQIVNGLKLAESMGCQLKKEIANNFPGGNLELRDFILDL